MNTTTTQDLRSIAEGYQQSLYAIRDDLYIAEYFFQYLSQYMTSLQHKENADAIADRLEGHLFNIDMDRVGQTIATVTANWNMCARVMNPLFAKWEQANSNNYQLTMSINRAENIQAMIDLLEKYNLDGIVYHERGGAIYPYHETSTTEDERYEFECEWKDLPGMFDGSPASLTFSHGVYDLKVLKASYQRLAEKIARMDQEQSEIINHDLLGDGGLVKEALKLLEFFQKTTDDEVSA